MRPNPPTTAQRLQTLSMYRMTAVLNYPDDRYAPSLIKMYLLDV